MTKKQDVDGAPLLIEEEQAAFVEDATEPRHGKHYAGGRKVVDLAHVGAATPDADADGLPRESQIERASLQRRLTRSTHARHRTLRSSPPPAPRREKSP
jgi:hypothetical protein